jgi:hypothetical protein
MGLLVAVSEHHFTGCGWQMKPQQEFCSSGVQFPFKQFTQHF